MRKHPITGETKMHRGVDVAGTFPVTSCGDGVLHSKGYNARGGGHWVKVDHGSRVYSVYYHGHRATQLNKGDMVLAGDFIYTSGSTGMSTGPHLHFEIRKGSAAWGFDVDPMPYLGGQGAGPGTGELSGNGRLDKTTQRKWQEVLKRDWHYRGRIDGVLGLMSWTAIQESLKPHGYTGKVDGIPGRLTYGALQRKLGRPVTGRLNAEDIRALQTSLNTGTY
jgi:hypothetical protein